MEEIIVSGVRCRILLYLAALLVSYWFILYELLIPIGPLFQLLYNFFYHGKNLFKGHRAEKCKNFPGPSHIFFLFTEELLVSG
jgi:hypothetical protein